MIFSKMTVFGAKQEEKTAMAAKVAIFYLFNIG
jgi:hypothetical protein